MGTSPVQSVSPTRVDHGHVCRWQLIGTSLACVMRLAVSPCVSLSAPCTTANAVRVCQLLGWGWYNARGMSLTTHRTALLDNSQVAGGWKKADGRYQGDNTVDLFPDPSSGAASTSFTLATDAFDVGAAVVGDTAYIVGNGALYTYSGSTAGTTTTLPQALVGASSMDGGGLIPGSHMQQNGVTVGPWVCYYGGSIDTSALPPALYCLHTVRMRWARLPCSVPHRGGAIALVGNSTVVIAGGFDPAATNAPATDVVDVFVLEV
jgi:hypothetical protein